MSTAAPALAALLAARRSDLAGTILTESTVDAATPFDPLRFEALFGAAGRRFGTIVLGGEATVSDSTAPSWSIATWGLDELARALLIVAGIGRIAAADQVTWLDGLHRAGAMRERQAILRCLALLPDPARFVPIALDACRASTQPVFEAIACENPYPASYFPETSFNHMVLKAVFTEVALARILGLATRRSTELARMAADYASERTAAGRSVPADLALVMSR